MQVGDSGFVADDAEPVELDEEDVVVVHPVVGLGEVVDGRSRHAAALREFFGRVVAQLDGFDDLLLAGREPPDRAAARVANFVMFGVVAGERW